jgi:hypothetical protein
MKFEAVKSLVNEKFLHLTKVKRSTFDKMVGVLDDSIKKIEKLISVKKRNLAFKIHYSRLWNTLKFFRYSIFRVCSCHLIRPKLH